jgi:hypothetical protein
VLRSRRWRGGHAPRPFDLCAAGHGFELPPRVGAARGEVWRGAGRQRGGGRGAARGSQAAPAKAPEREAMVVSLVSSIGRQHRRHQRPPRGSIEWPRGGAHERVELLAARGQRLRARGERVERRGAQQQGSSVRRPQCCGDAGECGAQRCPHLSFRNRSPQCCSCSLSVSLAAPLQVLRAKSSCNTPHEGEPSRLPDPELNGAPRSGPRGGPRKQHGLSVPRFEGCNERESNHTSARAAHSG